MTPPRQPVTPVARAWLAAQSAAQDAKGIQKYGVELLAGDDVDGMEHLGQELVDAIHYFTKVRLERDEINQTLRRWLAARDAWIANDQAQANVDDVFAASADLETLARRVLGGERRRPLDTAGSSPGRVCTYDDAGEPSVCARCGATGWHFCEEGRKGE